MLDFEKDEWITPIEANEPKEKIFYKVKKKHTSKDGFILIANKKEKLFYGHAEEYRRVTEEELLEIQLKNLFEFKILLQK